MESTRTRKPCFLEDDNGLASIADHALSSSPENHHHLLCSPRKTCPPNFLSFLHVSSPRSMKPSNHRKFVQQQQQQDYFLDACFLCKKTLGGNIDIFMYRGDTAFCSEECRREEIDKDEAKEKWKVSVSMVTKGQSDNKSSNASSPNSTSKNYIFQSGAALAAA